MAQITHRGDRLVSGGVATHRNDEVGDGTTAGPDLTRPETRVVGQSIA